MDARRLLLSIALASLISGQPGAAQSNQGSAPQRSLNKAMVIGLASVAIPTTVGLVTVDHDSGVPTWPLLLTSWILGPAPGLFYAGNDQRAWDGMAFRTLTLAVAAGGVAIMAANFDLFDDSNDGGVAAGLMIGLVATGLTVHSWIKDLREIRPSVERFNAGLQAAPLLTLDGRVGAQLTYSW